MNTDNIDVRERTTADALHKRVAAGARWSELLVAGLEITDIGVVVLACHGFTDTYRSRRVTLLQMCCGKVVDGTMNGLLTRIRRHGTLCRPCTNLKIARRAVARNRREARDLARRPPEHDAQWAFGLMDSALKGCL